MFHKSCTTSGDVCGARAHLVLWQRGCSDLPESHLPWSWIIVVHTARVLGHWVFCSVVLCRFRRRRRRWSASRLLLLGLLEFDYSLIRHFVNPTMAKTERLRRRLLLLPLGLPGRPSCGGFPLVLGSPWPRGKGLDACGRSAPPRRAR